MKVILTNEQYAEKVNFVDDNNCFVGYDLSEHCCEDAGWFIDISPWASIPKGKGLDKLQYKIDFPLYNFDTSYVEEYKNERDFNEGGLVRFRLTNGESYIYLHIYNSHNGYYSHGFEYQLDANTDKKKGSL